MDDAVFFVWMDGWKQVAEGSNEPQVLYEWPKVTDWVNSHRGKLVEQLHRGELIRASELERELLDCFAKAKDWPNEVEQYLEIVLSRVTDDPWVAVRFADDDIPPEPPGQAVGAGAPEPPGQAEVTRPPEPGAIVEKGVGADDDLDEDDEEWDEEDEDDLALEDEEQSQLVEWTLLSRLLKCASEMGEEGYNRHADRLQLLLDVAECLNQKRDELSSDPDESGSRVPLDLEVSERDYRDIKLAAILSLLRKVNDGAKLSELAEQLLLMSGEEAAQQSKSKSKSKRKRKGSE